MRFLAGWINGCRSKCTTWYCMVLLRSRRSTICKPGITVAPQSQKSWDSKRRMHPEPFNSSARGARKFLRLSPILSLGFKRRAQGGKFCVSSFAAKWRAIVKLSAEGAHVLIPRKRDSGIHYCRELGHAHPVSAAVMDRRVILA